MRPASIVRRLSSLVVPANAGTHTPRPLDLGTVANGFCSNKRIFNAVTASAAKQSSFSLAAPWIASRSLSSGAHSRDPLARNDAGARLRILAARLRPG
jgi:hypothetical protein